MRLGGVETWGKGRVIESALCCWFYALHMSLMPLGGGILLAEQKGADWMCWLHYTVAIECHQSNSKISNIHDD